MICTKKLYCSGVAKQINIDREICCQSNFNIEMYTICKQCISI